MQEFLLEEPKSWRAVLGKLSKKDAGNELFVYFLLLERWC